MTNKDVVNLFLARERAEANNLRSTGMSLYSYDYKVAEWAMPGTVVINTEPSGQYEKRASGNMFDLAYSATTNRHRALVRAACGRRGIPVEG